MQRLRNWLRKIGPRLHKAPGQDPEEYGWWNTGRNGGWTDEAIRLYGGDDDA